MVTHRPNQWLRGRRQVIRRNHRSRTLMCRTLCNLIRWIRRISSWVQIIWHLRELSKLEGCPEYRFHRRHRWAARWPPTPETANSRWVPQLTLGPIRNMEVCFKVQLTIDELMRMQVWAIIKCLIILDPLCLSEDRAPMANSFKLLFNRNKKTLQLSVMRTMKHSLTYQIKAQFRTFIIFMLHKWCNNSKKTLTRTFQTGKIVLA